MTRKRKSRSKTIVYLQHWQLHNGAITHYAGLTTPERADERQREHLRGTNCVATRNLLKRGYECKAVQYFPNGTNIEERWMQAKGVAELICDYCRANHLGPDLGIIAKLQNPAPDTP